eukprot:281551_1
MSDVLGLIMKTIDVHGGYTITDLVKDLEQPISIAKAKPFQTVLVFLDEINTSPEVGSFKEVVCDHSLKGEKFPKNLVIIAALNPYRKRKITEEQIKLGKNDDKNNPKYYIDELDKEMSDLVYRVYPIPPSMKTYVWNFGYLTPQDENVYISVITTTTWNSKKIQKGIDANKEKEIELLKSLFIHLIFKSQLFLRKYLYDVSVCSLRDVTRCNDLFEWFFNVPRRKKLRTLKTLSKYSEVHLKEAMILSLTQCYYYRLSERLRKEYSNFIQNEISKYGIYDIKFEKVAQEEVNHLINNPEIPKRDKLTIPDGIALNRAFKENLFVMLVGIARKIPTVIVGKPGSSKTLAMVTLQDNLSSATKNNKLTKMGFDDYFVVSFQCSKLTTADGIERRWKFA